MSGSAGLRPPLRRALAAMLALASLLLGAWLTVHHPLSPTLALLLFSAAGAASAWRPVWALAGLLALLPWAGLMPWTGWLIIEEFDLLVLAVAAGGQARIALGWLVAPSARLRLTRVWLLWLSVMVVTAIGARRGIHDAGGLVWGWWQGYREPLNSLRLAKPVIAVTLLLPVWRAAWRADAAAATRSMGIGMMGMLGATALGVVWERLAFTGLLDFSSDYRATGLFWEMHVGGAALDAIVAVSVPFALVGWRQARTPLQWIGAAVISALGLYAAMVTFSRIVYLAVPLGMVCTMLLIGLQAPQRDSAAKGGWATAGAGAALYLALAWWVFAGSGYRGLLALLGAVVLMLPLAHLQTASRTPWAPAALVFALFAAVAVSAISAWLPKGAYVAYGLAWVATAAAVWLGRGGSLGAMVLAWAGFGGVLVALPAVSLHWGEATGLERSLPVAVLLAAISIAARRSPPWSADWRRQGRLLGLCGVLSVGVGVFGGGAYMGDRMATTRQDGQDRRAHWASALEMLRSPADQLLGKGLGRFPAQHAMSGRTVDQTGDYRLETAESGNVLVITGGKHELGWGEIFRVSQRIAAPSGTTTKVRLRVRTQQPVELQLEVCEKHLLYNAACLVKQHAVQPAGGQWQAVEVVLGGDRPTGGPWYAPRLVVFSVGLGTPGARVEVDELSLMDGGGEQLVNGDFERGLARWFMSSDRHHLPWHVKNVVVHLLFEQGLLGAAVAALLLAAALWHITLGGARHHALAPPLAGAVVGLLTVGMVDSLLDVPRVAFVLWWLLIVALALPGNRPAVTGRRPAP